MSIQKGRKLLATMLVLALFMSLLPVGIMAEEEARNENTVVFTIDQEGYSKGNQYIETDVAPYIKDGRTMVPVAYVAPALGTEKAQWIPSDQMVLISKDETQVAIFIGSNELLVNGKKVKMDAAAEIKDIGNGGGRTMLPIAFIAKALEVGYEWKADERSAYFYGDMVVYDQPGNFGPKSGLETIEGNVIVKSQDVVLNNLVVKGNLTIAEEVGDGDVTLNNITVNGDTFIRGGGKDSIHINGGQYKNIIIENVGGQVRVVATDVTGARVVIAEEAQGEEIILEGTFEKVTVEAPGVNLRTQGQTTINQIEVKEQAQESKIELARGTVVKEMVADTEVEVKGKENINKITGNVKEESTPTAPSISIPSPGSSRSNFTIGKIANITNLKVGETREINIEGKFTPAPSSMGVTTNNESVGIVSSNDKILKDKILKVEGLKIGETEITVTAKRSGYRDGVIKFNVTVVEADVEEPEVDKDISSIKPLTVISVVYGTPVDENIIKITYSRRD